MARKIKLLNKPPEMKFGCYAVVQRNEGEIFTWVSTHALKSDAVEAAKGKSDRIVVHAWIVAERPTPFQSQRPKRRIPEGWECVGCGGMLSHADICKSTDYKKLPK